MKKTLMVLSLFASAAMAQTTHTYIHNEKNVVQQVDNQSTCLSTNKSSDPDVILYIGAHVQNYDYSVDGQNNNSSSLSDMYGISGDIYIKNGDEGMGIGNSTYIGLRAVYDKGDVLFDGTIPDPSGPISTRDDVEVTSLDLELVLRDWDRQSTGHTYLEYILGFNEMKRDFPLTNYQETYTHYLFGIGFGVETEISDNFFIGLDLVGKISPFGKIKSKGPSHSEKLSTTFTWMGRAEIPFRWKITQQSSFHIIPLLEYWSYDGSSSSPTALPKSELTTWKVEAGLSLEF